MTDKLDLENLPDFLTLREVASLLRVSMLTVKRWHKAGKIEAIRINTRGDRRFKKEVVLQRLGLDREVSNGNNKKVAVVGPSPYNVR